VYVINVEDCVVDDPDEVLFGEGLVLGRVSPLLLHLQTDALQHALEHFLRIHLLLALLVVYAEQRVYTSHCYRRALVLEVGPGDLDVDLLNVAEPQGEGQPQLVDERRFERHVLDGDLPVQQPYVQTVLESLNVLAQVLH